MKGGDLTSLGIAILDSCVCYSTSNIFGSGNHWNAMKTLFLMFVGIACL